MGFYIYIDNISLNYVDCLSSSETSASDLIMLIPHPACLYLHCSPEASS